MLGDEELCRMYHADFVVWYAQLASAIARRRNLVIFTGVVDQSITF